MTATPTSSITGHPPEIVVFTHAQVRTTPVMFAGCKAHCHLDYRNFHGSGIAPQAFVIKSDDETYQRRIVRQLRRDPEYASALAFLDGKAPADIQALTDGPLPGSPQQLLERIHDTQSRRQTMLARSDNQDADATLIEFMWLRPGYVLEPLPDWRSPRRYRYPLIEAFDRSESDPETWVRRLEQNALIEPVALRDRQRECDFCGSAHLNFIDVCPSCHSLDIDQHSALHCFTCGFIAPEQQFLRGDHRVCPKCENRLRHIGSDYDRPLETCACAECKHVFVEGEVVARCAVCRRSMEPTSLKLHRIHSWRLTGAGRLAAQGRRDAVSTKANRQGCVSMQAFASSLDWMLRLTRGSSGMHFTLVGLYLQNLALLREKLGVTRSALLIDEVTQRLREQLADQDLMTRDDEERIYLLVPNHDRRGLRALHDAFDAVTTQSRQDDGTSPSWRRFEIAVDHEHAAQTSADSLLAQLRGGGSRVAPQIGRVA